MSWLGFARTTIGLISGAPTRRVTMGGRRSQFEQRDLENGGVAIEGDGGDNAGMSGCTGGGR
eukprot:1777909-Pyramimonas_sp.AAC.1